MNIDMPLAHQLPELRALWKEAFGDTDTFLDAFFETAFSADRCRCVTLDGKVAAVLYWFGCEYEEQPIAYIYAVATLSAYRGQGLCHKLLENTHEHLAKLGYVGAILVPGSEGLFRLYESMGYQTCSSIRTFDCKVGMSADTMDIRRIGTSEYTSLRRNFLPAGSVIQEQENLAFLETQAEFYAGDDFLLVACKNGDSLLGIELLGNEAHAPRILATLGYKKGTFRTPGQKIPFAMFYPLGADETSAPTYFGFAFD